MTRASIQRGVQFVCRAALAGVLLAAVPDALGSRVRAEDAGDVSPEEESDAAIVYTAEITSLADRELRERMVRESQVWALRKDGAPSLAALRARARRDEEALSRILRGLGYYDARVNASVVANGPPGPTATIEIEPGPRFVFGEIKVLIEDAGGTAPKVARPTGPASGRAVVDLEAKVIADLKAIGHVDARFIARRAILNRPQGALDLEIIAHAGPIAYIEAIDISGARTVGTQQIVKLSGLRTGDRIVPADLSAARAALEGLDVFERVRIEPVEGSEPRLRRLSIDVEERKHRTIGVGLRWQSSEGLGAKARWEHRNLFGGAERLSGDLTAAERLIEGGLLYRQKAAVRLDRLYLAEARLANEESDAFDETRLTLTAGVEQRLREYLRGRIGMALEWERADDGSSRRDSYLVGLPLGLSFDDTDDPLDPHAGVRAHLGLGPYIGAAEGELGFMTLEFGLAAFHAIEGPFTPVVAARVRLGATLGPTTSELPPSKRFFSGGGGSVRGYEYQSLGPRDEENEPAGGKSLLEGGVELRTRFRRNLGLVVYLDAGSAFQETLPFTTDRLFLGAGVGALYYTPIGPVRFDIAVPMTPRSFDDPYQVYLSIGQSF